MLSLTLVAEDARVAFYLKKIRNFVRRVFRFVGSWHSCATYVSFAVGFAPVAVALGWFRKGKVRGAL